jgi:ABC-type multidrug transport system fused ATPase/permease subunit
LAAAELIVSAMLSGLTRLGKSITSYYDLMAGMDKLSYLLDLPAEQINGERLKGGAEGFRLEARGLIPGSPSPRGDETPLPLSFEARPGSRLLLALSTRDRVDRLLGTLGGLVPPRSGSVQFNGIELSLIDRAQLRDEVTLLIRPEWFEVRIIDNLRLGREAIASEAIHEVLQRLGILDRFTQLPEGLNTRLVRNGFPLDDSELALLSLARALILPTRLLLIGQILELLEERDLDPVIRALLAEDESSTRILVTSSPRMLSLLEGRLPIVRDVFPGGSVHD